MARPSKLSPDQWAEVERRAAQGETARALAREFGVDEAAIRRRVSPQTPRIKEVAAKVVEARQALAVLPVQQQYTALRVADQLMEISTSFAAAAALGARTGHRLHALANSEVCKVDDANPLSAESLTALKGVGVLTKLANEALTPASNLLAANKEAIKELNAKSDGDDDDADLSITVRRRG